MPVSELPSPSVARRVFVPAGKVVVLAEVATNVSVKAPFVASVDELAKESVPLDVVIATPLRLGAVIPVKNGLAIILRDNGDGIKVSGRRYSKINGDGVDCCV